MHLLTLVIAAAAGLAQSTVMAAESTNRAIGQVAPDSAHSLRVVVDPRVELLSLIFRLAGNPEYSEATVKSYDEDAEKQFGKFRGHAVVNLAQELRRTHNVSYDAVMKMAVHLTDAEQVKLKLPLQPWPEGLDRRWTAGDVSNFLAAAQQFVKDSSFKEFIEQHRPLYQTTVTRMQTLMEKEAHLDWFDAYFGRRPQAGFTVVLRLLSGGGGSYGLHFRAADGSEELYCVLGVRQTDKQGLPEFPRAVLPTVVHEFCHSYANPLIERHLAELRASGDALFENVAGRMRSQAYGNAQTMLKESLVRACVIRYLRQYEGEEAARRRIEVEKRNGFLWMQEMSDLLGDYEAHREKYPTLEDFSPRLAAFFTETAKKQADLAAKRPKVVSMIPANGAQDVDPGLISIQVLFDRPMADKSWSLVGKGPHFPSFPKIGEGAHFDAQHKVWTVPVELKPDWSYEFMLNSETYVGFASQEGVPLQPVSVTFKTAGQTGTGQTN